MKIRMLVSRCGPKVNDAPGDIVDVPDDEAERMMDADPPQCREATAAEIKADDKVKSDIAATEKEALAKAKAEKVALKKAERAALVAKAKAEKPETAVK